jgi:hypothetical protein
VKKEKEINQKKKKTKRNKGKSRKKDNDSELLFTFSRWQASLVSGSTPSSWESVITTLCMYQDRVRVKERVRENKRMRTIAKRTVR